MSSLLLSPDIVARRSIYLERTDRREGEFDRWSRGLLTEAVRPFVPIRQALWREVKAASSQQGALAQLSDEALRMALRHDARHAMTTKGELAHSLALVREAAKRSIGMAPFDVQLLGAAVLLSGRLAEMQTGEGKTLTAAIAAAVAACAGVPVHVVTVNDYLADRDASVMSGLFAFLGLTVGTIVSGMCLEERRAAYRRSITYCTNKELVFDYLKDRVGAGERASALQSALHLTLNGGQAFSPLLRGLHFAIVDEADSILIDEAKTPLILAEQVQGDRETPAYCQAIQLAQVLREGIDYEMLAGGKDLQLTESGKERAEVLSREFDANWRSVRAREMLVEQALRALHLYQREVHYLASDGKIQIIDEFTGRILDGRTWERGLHQLIEAKEGLALSNHNRTLARITYQRFFSRYLRLSGMTGTVSEVGRELRDVYRLDTVRVPTNRPCIRKVLRTEWCCSKSQKWQRVADEVVGQLGDARPLLIGTRSVRDSEELSAVLASRSIPHAVLNAKHDAQEAAVVADAGMQGKVTVATNMAGRGTDIRLGTGVADRGGLHVILTEFHDSRRIDRQLFGRCARQGDPGSAIAIVSLEDDLFRDFGDLFWLVVKKARSSLVRKLLYPLLRQRAQRAAGRRNARARRETLKHDRAIDGMLSFSGRGS
jgi:preprotein translocase subunit SecA